MEIKIKLNDLKYRYDVYQMFNIYYSLDEIKFEDDGDYIVEVLDDKINFTFKDFNKTLKVGEKIKEDVKRFSKFNPTIDTAVLCAQVVKMAINQIAERGINL